MSKKILLSLFDLTGNASRPYRENGWIVKQVDIQLGVNLFDFPYKEWYEYTCYQLNHGVPMEIGIIAMEPCTDYALSGSRHFKAKDSDGRTEQSQRLVSKTKEIIDYFEAIGVLIFWQLEQPMTRIHTLNPWLGKPFQKFNPCDFAGYDPVPENSRYNKQTWLFGRFNKMIPKRLEPIDSANPGWSKLGGKSLKTKNARSITPLGFAYAFYEANN